MSKEKITVYRPGTHAGKRYTPGPDGLVLEVSASQAKALREAGADKPPTGVTDSARAADTAPPPAPANAPAGAGAGAGGAVTEAPADKTSAARAPRGG